MPDSASNQQAAQPPARRGVFGDRVRRSMMPVFFGLTVTLFLLGLLITQTMVAQREARTQAIAEGDALIASHQVLAAVLDAETGQRGYLLTRNREYLEPYRDAKRRLELGIVALQSAERRASDPVAKQRIAQISGLTRAKFIELDRSVALSSAGFGDQALVIIQSDIGKHQMDAIRAQIAFFREEKARKRLAAFERAADLEQRLLPLIVVVGLAIFALVVAGFRAERSRARATAFAAQAEALADANERANLLTRELNHRVKNLFSVILSIVALSARKPASTAEVVEDIRSRVRALALAHDTSQGGTSDERTDLGALITRTMEPYADQGGERVRINGCQVNVPMRMVTPMGLIIHELATNAVKYGALSSGDGKVAIDWDLARDGAAHEVSLRWTETGGPALAAEKPEQTGFGSKMTELAAQQMGGALERQWPREGAVALLRFPLG